MAKPLTIICFIVVAAAQWFVTGHMIWKHEEIIKKGKVLRFESAPYDPENPFLGRYVSLNFQPLLYRQNSGKNRSVVDFAIKRGQKVFVTLTSNPQGYAQISGLSLNRPATGDYLLIESSFVDQYGKDTTSYGFFLPFREFYMEESRAPMAERIYAERLRDSTTRSYATVRIWQGEGLIENVFINDSTLQQIISASSGKNK